MATNKPKNNSLFERLFDNEPLFPFGVDGPKTPPAIRVSLNEQQIAALREGKQQEFRVGKQTIYIARRG